MVRLLMVLLLLPLAAAAAPAADYRDEAARYRLTVPAGWTKSAEFSDADGQLWESPRSAETMGFCLVVSDAMPDTRAYSQLEIDSGLAGQFDAAFWREAFKEMKNLDVQTAGEEMQNGRRIYYALMAYDDDEEPVRIKVKAVLHVVPGRMHSLYCAAKLADYAREEADFEAFLRSFLPDGPELLVNAEPFARPVVHRTDLLRAIHGGLRAAAPALKRADPRAAGRRR